MFHRLLASLTGSIISPGEQSDQVRISVATLLVQAATMDDHFDAAERLSIRRLLGARFDLDPRDVEALIHAAETESNRSVQLYPLVRVLIDQLDVKARVAVIEMLWEVAYADGVLHPDEDALIRRVAGLLYVSDFDRGEARKRARERSGLPLKQERHEGL